MSVLLPLALAASLSFVVGQNSQGANRAKVLSVTNAERTTGDADSSPVSKTDLDKLGIEFIASRKIGESAQRIWEYKLKKNGLSILLSERHAMPVATVMVVYHVGSRNEAVGYTGSTHFLEHMMFKGTNKHDPLKGTGLDDVLKPVGGYNNATTSYDRTNYFEIVPSKSINVCLDLEADRMRHLLLRQEDHDSEMTVVRNELERGQDEPQELLQQNLFATAFQEHPYHHPVIGWRSDVENVPIKRLRQFYDEFYWPNNATLIVIGDYALKPLLQQIAQNFAAIPHSPNKFPTVYTQEPPQEGERRFTVQRGAELPRVGIGFHGVNARSKDDHALDLLETIYGDESKKSGRLYKALVDTGLASETSANNTSLRDPGLFQMTATAAGQTKLPQLEKALLEQIDKAKTELVTDEELKRAKQSVLKRIRLANSDPVGMAEQLAESVAIADWRWLSDYPEKIKAVTADDIKKAANKYFQPQFMTVGYYIPKTQSDKSDEHLADSDKKQEKAGQEAATERASATGAVSNAAAENAAENSTKDYAPPANIVKSAESTEKLDSKTPVAGGGAPASPLPTAPAPNNETKPVDSAFKDRPSAGTHTSSDNLIAADAAVATKTSPPPVASSVSSSPKAPGTDANQTEGEILSKSQSDDQPMSSARALQASGPGKFASEIRRFELSNGLKLVIMPIKGTGTVAVSGKIKAGQYFSEPDKTLVPEFVGDLLTAGCSSYTKEQLAKELESLGTTLNFTVDDFWLSFNSEITSEDLSKFMPLIAGSLEEPSFDLAEVDKSKKLKTATIKDQMSDTGSVALNRFMEAWYKPSSVYYDRPFDKQLEELPQLRVSDLKEFHKKHVTPANTVLTIVGDIEVTQALNAVQKAFSRWSGHAADKIEIRKSDVYTTATAPMVTKELPDKANVDVIVGRPIDVSVRSPDYFPTLLANSALGYDSFACRLAPIRDKYGLTYGIYSAFTGEFPYAPWTIVFSVNPENYKRANFLVHQIVGEYIKGGITAQELTKEKAHLEGAFYVGLRGPRQIANKLCELEILGPGATFIDNYGANIRGVKQADVNRCIRQYFSLDGAVTSSCGTLQKQEKARASDKNGER